MINRVVLVGRLTRDPELRTTGSGISVATFTLAVDRQYTNAQGERGADFISCVIWRKRAENFCNFTLKGSLVGIDGRLQTRSYDNKDGQRVYVTEVIVDNFALLESRKQSAARNQSAGFTSNNNGESTSATSTNNFQPKQDHQPAAKPKADKPDSKKKNGSSQDKPKDPFASSGDTIDISDDDLPF